MERSEAAPYEPIFELQTAPYELNFELQNLEDDSNSRHELVFSECGNNESKLGNLYESIAPSNQTPRH